MSTKTNDGHYLIFVPDVVNPTAEQLTALGIADLVAGLPAHPIERGLGCRPGYAFVVQGVDAPQPTEPPEVSTVKTNWLPSSKTSKGKPVCWFGFDAETRPGPEDLRRAKLFESTSVNLCDGNEWQVALIDCLPAAQKDSTLTMLCEEIQSALSLRGFKSQIKGHTYICGSRTLVCAALRANYRVPRELVGSEGLRLFDFDTLAMATVAGCGIKRAIQKYEYKRHTTAPGLN
ncbi:MAG: hypothetical protein GXP26_05075 [Planctomycetes bacterium]|nr:hypothetical protein [Planctomycetota bacterium]